MHKKLLLVLLLAPLLFTACKKDDPTANEFTINGISDVDLSTAAGSKLDLSVASTSGSAEQVTLSVTGLPAGVTATVDPKTGTPPFSATVTFSQSGQAVAGTYPIFIAGKAASYLRSYDLSLTVPALNGWTVDGTAYRLFDMSKNSIMGSSVLTALSYDNGSAYLNASITGTFPTADGTYAYDLFSGSDPAKTMSVTFMPMNGEATLTNDGTDGKTATLKVSGGKYSLSFPETSFSSAGGSETKAISAAVTQK